MYDEYQAELILKTDGTPLFGIKDKWHKGFALMLDRSIQDNDWHWRSIIHKLVYDGIISNKITSQFHIRTTKPIELQCKNQFRSTIVGLANANIWAHWVHGNLTPVHFIYKKKRYVLSKNNAQIEYRPL